MTSRGLLKYDRCYVQRIEAGTANPGIDVICRVRVALAASWDALLRNAQWHELRPLRGDQVGAFHIAQWPHVKDLAEKHGVTKEQYEDAARCLATTVPQGEPERLSRSAVVGLRNPIDGVLTAERLACNDTPDLTKIIEQHVLRMAETFKHNFGQEFPWKRFAEEVFKWRSDDSVALTLRDFPNETKTMKELQLLLPLGDGSWRFRHDRIMAHFLVHAFLKPDEKRLREKATDSRFVGVYRLLPRHLSAGDCKSLKEWLAEWAAKDDAYLPAFRALMLGCEEEGC